VQDAIKALQDWVGSKVDAVIEWARTQFQSLVRSGSNLAQRGLDGIRAIINRVKNNLWGRIRGQRLTGNALLAMLDQVKNQERFSAVRAIPKPGVRNQYTIVATVNPDIPLGDVIVTVPASATATSQGSTFNQIRSNQPGGIASPGAATRPTPSNPSGRIQLSFQSINPAKMSSAIMRRPVYCLNVPGQDAIIMYQINIMLQAKEKNLSKRN
jgi:hypothetical protein